MFRKGVLKENSKFFDYCKRILDLTIIFFSSWAAYLYKFGLSKEIHSHYWIFILVGVLISFILFNTLSVYHSWRGISLFAEYRVVFVSWFFSCLVLMLVSFIFKISIMYSREWLIEWFIIGLFFLIVYRFFFTISISYLRRKGFNQKWVCLVAMGDSGRRVFEKTKKSPWLGYSISAVFSNEFDELYSNKYKGGLTDAFTWLMKNDIDQIWIAIPLEKVSILQKVVHEMRHKTADIRFIPDLNSFNLVNHSISEIMGMPYVNITASPMQEFGNVILKRIEDLLLSSFILIIISPIFLVVSIIIKLTSPGPIFYKQTRIGLNNKPFTIFKFRTMPVGIEDKTGAVWAKSGERRATFIGSFLRKASIDELPQFFNVFKGDMSVVGPRPERPEFVEQFKDQIPYYMKKHMVKAGITGWAQINGWRGNTDLTKRIEHDIYYIENWSLLFDLKIIILTLIKGFFNKNAY